MEFIVAIIAGMVFVWVLKGLQHDQTRNVAGKSAKVCPYCAEHVKAAAVVCRYCQRDLPPPAVVAKPAPKPAPARRVPDNTVIFWMIAGFVALGIIGGLLA
jgi:hypothetical protein